MGNKWYALVGVALLLLPVSLAAQKNYRLEDSGGEQHFIQRLSWQDDGTAFRYEITVEAGEAEDWQEILREFTETDYLEVSLPAGQYRYRIRAYDFFDEPSDYSPWFPLEIQRALRPEILGLVSGDAVKKNDRNSPLYALSLDGENLLPTSVLSLTDKKGKTIPLELQTDDNGLVLLKSPLPPGDYRLTVENPGGFTSTVSFTITRPASDANRYASLGYSPLLPLYGSLNEMLDALVYPAGAYARFEYAPFTLASFSFGFGAAPSWNYIVTKYTQSQKEYDVSAQFLGARAYLLGQKRFLDNTLVLNLRLGGGAYLMMDLRKETAGESYDPTSALFPTVGGELSLLWVFREPFFAEAGAAYLHFFSVDDPSPGFVQPFFGLGLRF